MISPYVKTPKDSSIRGLGEKRQQLLNKLKDVDTAITSLQNLCDHDVASIDTSGHRSETTEVCRKCGLELDRY